MFKTKLVSTIGVIGLLFCFAAVQNISAQNVANYTFTPSSGTFTALSGANVPVLQTGFDLDDGYFQPVPIGFTFKFDGTNYTQVSASTNGWMSFPATTTFQFNNSLDGTFNTPRPFVAPFYDDLSMIGGGSVTYLTTGASPNRVFTMQWLNVKWDYQGTTPAISFQVKLFETTNRVQFIYRQESGAVSNTSGGASIGLAGTGNGSGQYLSLNNSGAAPTASSTTDTRNISTKPANGQTYTFAPIVTASAVTISGRVMTNTGNGLFNSYVSLTDSEGATRITRTTSFGYYRFDGVESGQTYIVSVNSKKFQFTPQVVTVFDNLFDLNFYALE